MLGDVSDAGRRSNNAQWNEVVSRFQSLVRPFAANPIHVVVGNHDVGDHHDPGFSSRLPRFASSFSGLDATCGSRFAWKGVDFVSLNAMAMHGDGCSVCSSVERSIENTMVSLKVNILTAIVQVRRSAFNWIYPCPSLLHYPLRA